MSSGRTITTNEEHLQIVDELDDAIGDWLDWGTHSGQHQIKLTGEGLWDLWERAAENVEGSVSELSELRSKVAPLGSTPQDGGAAQQLLNPFQIGGVTIPRVLFDDTFMSIFGFLLEDPPHDRVRALMACKPLYAMRDVQITVDVEGWRNRLLFETVTAERECRYPEDMRVFVRPMWVKKNDLPRQMKLFAEAARATDGLLEPLEQKWESFHPIVLGSKTSLVMRACAEGEPNIAMDLAKSALSKADFEFGQAAQEEGGPTSRTEDDTKGFMHYLRDMVIRLSVFGD